MNQSNVVVPLHGIGWYGFESSDMLTLPDNPSRLGSDVSTVMQRMHMMGFNLVHFGISFSQLYNPDGSYKLAFSPAGLACPGSSSAAAIINSVTIPGFAPAPNSPLLSNAPSAGAGMCNDYLPDVGEPVVQRLAAVIDIFTRNGMYVLLVEDIDKDTALANDATAFANQWSKLAQDLITFAGAYEGLTQPSCSADPNGTPLALCHNTILGLLLNIDKLSTNLSWEPNSYIRPVGTHQLYDAAISVLQPLMPRTMFALAGGFQYGFSSSFNIGVNAQTTNFPPLAGNGAVASAADFFSELVNQPLESQVMFGFTAFGPTFDHWLGQFATANGGMDAKLSNDFDTSYGGVASGSVVDSQQVTHYFPALPVAFGGSFSDPNDTIFLNAMRTYMLAHHMPNFVWWCWNGQTGTNSPLTDANYLALDPHVVDYLVGFGLRPL